ncbi:MAG: asparagine synthetase B [Lachnospiraceae bacterium]|nr:asparagine synthetase B [Lachnospiraceae bacterium]
MFTVFFDHTTKTAEFPSSAFENDDIIYVTDGEIFNCESVASLWKKKGFEEMVSCLNGSFSLVLFDKNTCELFIARDRLGAKQLYYSLQGDRLMISSHFAPVFEFAGNQVDPVALQHYFTFQYVPEPMTIGLGVKALRLGHWAKASDRDFEEVEFNTWKPSPVEGKDREQFKNEIREKLTSAVKKHLKGAVNPAAFLSGGLDSSILTAIASKDFPNMTAYTIAFDIPGFSEAEVAAESARKYGIKHEIVRLGSRDFKEAVPFAIKAMGVPVADPSATAVSLIAKAAVGKTDVIISGEGSDELWGGYHVYNPRGRVLKIMALPGILKKLIWFFARFLPDDMRGKDLLRRGCVPIEKRFVGNTFLFTDREKKKLLKKFDGHVRFTDVTAPYYKEATGLSDMDKMQYIDTNIWLPGDIDVVCGKGCSERGLKCVTPFMDNEVTSLAATLTRDEKLQGTQNKVILREAFEDLLTGEVRNGVKRGYPVPVRVWLSGELNDWARGIINNANVSAFIDKREALKLLDKCQKNPDDPVCYRKAWAVIVFCLWYREVAEAYASKV